MRAPSLIIVAQSLDPVNQSVCLHCDAYLDTVELQKLTKVSVYIVIQFEIERRFHHVSSRFGLAGVLAISTVTVASVSGMVHKRQKQKT